MNGVALENGKVMTPRPLEMHEMITMDVIEKQYPRSSRLKSRLKQKEEEALKSEVGAMKSMIESLGIEEAAGDHLKPHEILGQTLWRARRGSDPKVIDALGKILLGAETASEEAQQMFRNPLCGDRESLPRRRRRQVGDAREVVDAAQSTEH